MVCRIAMVVISVQVGLSVMPVPAAMRSGVVDFVVKSLNVMMAPLRTKVKLAER
jgi:hypothetical protein